MANSRGQARGPGTAIRTSEHESEVPFFLDLLCAGVLELLEELEDVVDDLPSDLSVYLPSNYSAESLLVSH
jgi:hypothetical protein